MQQIQSGVNPSREVWKETNYPNVFVSDQGRVRGSSGKILKPRKHRNGYVRVQPKAGIDAFIHTLVLETFLCPRPSRNHEADHVNLDRADNRLENLRWLTVSENRARRRRTLGERNGCSKLTLVLVNEIRASTERSSVLAAKYGVTARHIRKLRGGQRWPTL